MKDEEPMKILQVNNVYGEKSTGKLTQVIHQGLLQAGHESLVVYGRGKGSAEPGVIRLCPEWYGKVNGLLARITGMPYGGCVLSTLRLMGIIRREKPDVVHLQCINGSFVNIYRLVQWLKNHRIKTVVSLHAEFMYTGNCGHAYECEQWHAGCKKCPDAKKANHSWFFDRTKASWQKMREAFRGFEEDCMVCPVSAWTEDRARQSDIMKDLPQRTVFNGVNTEVFRCREQQRENNVVLNVTAHFSGDKNHPKGGWYLIELARRMPEVTFLVAGPADRIPDLPENLRLLGNIADQKELAERYGEAKLSVIVSQRETFSMPCAESLCCGTPVVGFKAGAPERISLSEYSEFVEHGDLPALEAVVRRWLARGDLAPAVIGETAERSYSANKMLDTFMEIYRSLLWN